MLLNTYIPITPLVTDNELSATDINAMRYNAMLLQGIAKRGVEVFQVHRKISETDDTAFDRNVPTDVATIWKGSFLYRVGMEDLSMVLFGNNKVGATGCVLSIWVNGVITADGWFSSDLNVDTTFTYAIDASGYTDYQVVLVEVQLKSDDASVTYLNKVYAFVKDAYVFPIAASMTTSYVAPDTFTDIAAAKFNKLCVAQDWIADRLNLLPYTGFQALLYWPAAWKAMTRILWYGMVVRSNGHDRLRASVEYTGRQQTSYVHLDILTAGTFDTPLITTVSEAIAANETRTIEFSIDISSLTADTKYLLKIADYCTVGPLATQKQVISSRIIVRKIWTEKTTQSYTAAPAESQMLESIVYTSLLSRLNAIGTITNAVKTTIDASTEVFNRVRLFRQRYVDYVEEEGPWGTQLVTYFRRLGDVLWIRGKGVKICYGAIVIESTADTNVWEYTFQFQEELIAGDEIATKYFYLDQFEGLYPGESYWIMGTSVLYAAEFLKG